MAQTPAPSQNPGTTAASAVTISVHLCIPDDQTKYLPKRLRTPPAIPPGVPVPSQGDVVYLSPTSAWSVQMVIHEWQAPDTLNIEVWLDHVGTTRHARPSGFALTQ